MISFFHIVSTSERKILIWTKCLQLFHGLPLH